MTAKRYFKRMWEEEFYIFDSNTISESDFEEKLEYQNYKAFEDSMMGDEVVNRLNEQHETIHRLQKNITELLSVDIEEELLEENKQLKHRLIISEKANFVTTLEKENEQLKNICKNLINEINKRGITVTMTDDYKELLE